MKIFLIFILLIVILFILVHNSNMLERHQVIEYRNGAEYVTIKSEIHWNRLFDYIMKIPREVLSKIRSKFFSTFEVS